MILTITIFCSILVGAGLAHPRVPRGARVGGLVGILVLSNTWLNAPFFGADPRTWHMTFLTGLVQTGVISIVVHVLPACIAYLVVDRMRRRKAKANDPQVSQRTQ